MKPSIMLAGLITLVVAVIFVVVSIFMVVAAGRWAFSISSGWHELARASIAWVVSFVAMQGWSHWLRNTPAP